MLKDRVNLYHILVDAKFITTTLYPDWSQKYFSSEEGVVNLFKILEKYKFYTNPINEFFKKYACDLFPNSKYCGGQSTQSQNTQTNQTQQDVKYDAPMNGVFSCILKSGLLSSYSKKIDGTESLTYWLPTGGEFKFLQDKSFVYFNKNNNKTVKGKWDCNGVDNFIVNMENNARLDSKVGKWKYDIQPQSSINEKDNTTHLIKKGDSGEHVKEVQELLKNNGHSNVSKDGESDGVFGDRTHNAVRDFQSSNKDNEGQDLKVTGHVDKATMDALKRKNLQENIKKVVDRNLKTISK